MKMVQLLKRVLNPRAETTRIPEVLDATIERNKQAMSSAQDAIDALLKHMEQPRRDENRGRSSTQ